MLDKIYRTKQQKIFTMKSQFKKNNNKNIVSFYSFDMNYLFIVNK